MKKRKKKVEWQCNKNIGYFIQFSMIITTSNEWNIYTINTIHISIVMRASKLKKKIKSKKNREREITRKERHSNIKGKCTIHNIYKNW